MPGIEKDVKAKQILHDVHSNCLLLLIRRLQQASKLIKKENTFKKADELLCIAEDLLRFSPLQKCTKQLNFIKKYHSRIQSLVSYF